MAMIFAGKKISELHKHVGVDPKLSDFTTKYFNGGMFL
jgi:hypothetical protein